MKKIIALFVLATLFVAGNAFAQNQLVATLKHGDTTTLFYGANALNEAQDAAEDGDVITLSEGAFGDFTVSKKLVIKGVGCFSNKSAGIASSQIGRLHYSEGLQDVTFEGFYIDYIREENKTSSNFVFKNCRIRSMDRNYGIDNWNFISCIINQFFAETNGMIYYSNCFIQWDGGTNATLNNCVITARGSSMNYCTVTNSIVCAPNYTWYTFPVTSTISNNLGIYTLTEYEEMFASHPTSNNVQVDSYSSVFKTFDGTYTDSETFELTDEAAATYLGDDGKQVGIYGGDHPFTTTLSYPQATSVNVAKKAVDGKLAVDIKFNGAE